MSSQLYRDWPGSILVAMYFYNHHQHCEDYRIHSGHYLIAPHLNEYNSNNDFLVTNLFRKQLLLHPVKTQMRQKNVSTNLEGHLQCISIKHKNITVLKKRHNTCTC